MVPSPDADALRVQEHVQSVQGREAGGIGQAGAVEEGRQERFESRARGGGVAGVDVGIERLGILFQTARAKDQLFLETE